MSGKKTTVGFRTDGFRGQHGFRVKFPSVQEEDAAPPAAGEVYTGPYEVRPTPSGRTLPTEGKTMTDDVTVEPIPYYETSNEAGGETVYIGV